MYPRNATSPEPIAIGPVVQISDGAVQTAGVTVRIKPVGVAETDGGGTTAYSTDGVVLYTPTQAETNYTSFVLVAKKSGCIPASVTVVTSESAVSGRVYVGTNGDKSGYSLTQTFPANFASLGINASGDVSRVTLVDTTTTNTDMRGTNNALLAASYTAPPSVNAIADQVWDESYSTHTTAGSFGKLMDTLRKSNRAVEGTVLASPTPTTTTFNVSGLAYPTGAFKHAVLWFADDASLAEQNSPILTYTNNGDGTSTIVLEEALTSAPTAGDTVLIDPTSHVHAVAAIQSGLATTANQVILIDRVSYALTALVGACSDAQTAAETYTLSIGGSTFTVDYSGLDASGNRSTTTLSKA